MIKSGNKPEIYIENKPGKIVSQRSKKASTLGESPVNVAISFDLNTLTKTPSSHTLRRYFLD